MAWFQEEKFEWLTDEAIAAEQKAKEDQNTDPPTKTIEQTQSTNPENSAPSRPSASFSPFVVEADNGSGYNVINTIDGKFLAGPYKTLQAAENAAYSIRELTKGTSATADPGQGAGRPELKTNAGVGATEDSGAPSTASTSATVNAGSANPGTITPQPNILDRFASYTYNASVYLVTPEQYDQYLKSSKKNINGYNLLFQSGGAPNNVGGPRGAANGNAGQGQGTGVTNFLTAGSGASGDAGRNPYFPNDFYIDSITLQNNLFGKATNAAHSVAELKFSVVEPANITLIDCLYKAVQESMPKDGSGSVNYAAAIYMMVIRFYGYDLNGNIKRVGAASAQGLTDSSAVVEKFIPFKIKEIQFTVSNKLVNYEFQCAPIGQIVATGTRRGVVTQDVELTGSTVGSMLLGDPVTGSTAQAGAATPGAATTAQTTNATSDGREGGTTATPTANTPTAPANASAAPTNKTNKPNKQGLMAALNELQQQYVKDKIYEIADVYKIEFAKGAEEIRDAKVAKPDPKTSKQFTPMGAAPSQNPSQSSPDKGAMDVNGRNQAVTAGQPIVQMIDQVIRNSAYITDQALVSIDETTGKPAPNPAASTKKAMKWYNIMMQTKQLGYDKIRNDYAYEITFVITPYQLTDFKSVYFPEGKFQGVHKKYPWWFTGVNTSVLDYQATFNKLYILTVTGSPTKANELSTSQKAYNIGVRETPFTNYQPRSTENSQGAAGKANELAASAAEYLYNPSDNANAKIRILGDPAWIQQGSLSGVATSITPQPFLPDGTINFDINDILFEISWQRPEDYSLNTGLADPYARTQATFGDRQPIQSAIYRAKSVTSEFRQGKFEQTIEGTLYQPPAKPAASATAASGSSASNASSNSGSTQYADFGGDTPTQYADFGGDTPGDSARENQAATGTDGFTQSAESSTYGEPGLKSAPEATEFSPGSSSGEFNSAEPQPNDTAAVASPAEPATSDGGMAAFKAAYAESQTAGRITADQRNEINQNDATADRLAQIGRDQEATRRANQIISRDW